MRLAARRRHALRLGTMVGKAVSQCHQRLDTVGGARVGRE